MTQITKYHNNENRVIGRLMSPFGFGRLFTGLDDIFDAVERGIEHRFGAVEDDKNYYLEIEAPGFEQKDVEISIDNNLLQVNGKNEKRGSFSQSVTLWPGIDTEKIDAKLSNGILTITLPKTEQTKKKKININ